MLNSIKHLEFHNKNVIDFNGYIEFLGTRFFGGVTEDERNAILTEGFIRFSKVAECAKALGLDDKNIKSASNRMNEIIKFYEKKGFGTLFNESNNEFKIYINELFGLSYAAVKWYDYKQIYKFDVDTFDLIRNQKPDEKIDCEFLEKMKWPYDTFFLENNFEFEDGGVSDSCLVSREASEHGLSISMYFFMKTDVVEEQGSHNYICLNILKGQKLTDALAFFNFGEERTKMFYQILNLVLFLTQPKVEVLKKHSNIKEKKTSSGVPKSYYNVAYDENEVGYKMGATIRQYKYIYENSANHGEKTDRTVKPHMRSGHFHHYWIGKRGQKELITKFVEPTFVKGGGKTVVLHNVKK